MEFSRARLGLGLLHQEAMDITFSTLVLESTHFQELLFSAQSRGSSSISVQPVPKLYLCHAVPNTFNLLSSLPPRYHFAGLFWNMKMGPSARALFQKNIYRTFTRTTET
ncbi:alpha--glucan [Moniliophthora roreri]|nr:alpha--glucan [Moniliophthora roreri]